MAVTFHTKIQDESVYHLLKAMATLYGRLLRRLYVDLYVRGLQLWTGAWISIDILSEKVY